MKREIVCSDCQKKLETIFKKTTAEHPEEHFKFVKGKLKFPCVCDNCSMELMPLQGCYAVSIWSDYGAAPYYEWENDYLTT